MKAKIELSYPRKGGTALISHLTQALKSAPNDAKIQQQLDDFLERMQVPVAGVDLFQAAWDVFSRTDTTKWQNLYYYSMYTNDWFTGEELAILNQLFSVMSTEIDRVSKL